MAEASGSVLPLPHEARDVSPDHLIPPSINLPRNGGGERIRTDGLLRARQALSQLSYTPEVTQFNGQGAVYYTLIPLPSVVGLDGVEPSTSRLSGVRSNRTELQAPIDSGSRIEDSGFVKPASFQKSKIQLSPSFISKC